MPKIKGRDGNSVMQPEKLQKQTIDDPEGSSHLIPKIKERDGNSVTHPEK